MLEKPGVFAKVARAALDKVLVGAVYVAHSPQIRGKRMRVVLIPVKLGAF